MRSRLTWVFLLFLVTSGGAYAEVTPVFYLADSNEPLLPLDVNLPLQYVDYGEIMVGTQLSLAIESDVAEHWAGFLVLDEESRDLGLLSYRGTGRRDSITAAAGEGAGIFHIFYWWSVPDLANNHIQGFDFYNGFRGWDVGQWFVVDYRAVEVGDLSFSFFWKEDMGPPPHDFGLISSIHFQQVPTRDFNLDHRVDFRDFAQLASYWPTVDDVDPNGLEHVDLDDSGHVDVSDLMLFSRFWLAQTKGVSSPLPE